MELGEKLASLFPHGDKTKVMVQHGAESIENAIKIARQPLSGRPCFCYSEAFHGSLHDGHDALPQMKLQVEIAALFTGGTAYPSEVVP